MPEIVAAGASLPQTDDSAFVCLAPDLHLQERPPTPPEISCFRQSTRVPLGRSTLPISSRRDTPISSEIRFGIKHVKDESAADVMQTVPAIKSSLQDFVLEKSEELYKSRKNAPLGHTRKCDIDLSTDKYSHKDFRFGVTTVASESVKTIIYQKDDESKFNDQRSMDEHDITQPVKRNYEWDRTGVDPETYRFGIAATTPLSGKGVAMCLTAPEPSSICIASQRVAVAQSASKHPLGVAKAVSSAVPENHAFGIKTTARDQWGAAECLKGQYSEEQQQPDKDLGISRRKLKPEFNIPAQMVGRVFGAATIRSDLKAPAVRSVGDSTNYGDELGSKGLLFPLEFTSDGVQQDDLLMERPPQQLRELFQIMGYSVEDDEFNAICEDAIKAFGTLSINSYRHTFNKRQLNIDTAC